MSPIEVGVVVHFINRIELTIKIESRTASEGLPTLKRTFCGQSIAKMMANVTTDNLRLCTLSVLDREHRGAQFWSNSFGNAPFGFACLDIGMWVFRKMFLRQLHVVVAPGEWIGDLKCVTVDSSKFF